MLLPLADVLPFVLAFALPLKLTVVEMGAGAKLVFPVENRLLITEDRLDPPDEIEGVRGKDLEESRFSPVVKLFRKLFGGGLGALFVSEDRLSMPSDKHGI